MTTAAVLAGGVAAAAVVVATSPHGPGLSPDSVTYLSTGDALEHGRGFRAYGGVPLTDFPPGYPLALGAWLETVGGRPFDAARAVNAASVFALVVLTGLVLRTYVTRTVLVAAGVVLVAAAPSVLHVSVFAWSEALFGACIMGCLFFLARSLARWRMLDVALAGACTSACVAVRFVGAGAVLAGLVALVVGAPAAVPRRDVVKRCLVFLGIASLAPAAWLASRISITDSPLGVRGPPRANVFENGRDAVASAVAWFVPDTFSDPVRALGFACAAGVLCAGAAMWVRSRPSSSPGRASALWLPALLAGSVVAVTVAGASITAQYPLDFRLLAPALAPSVVLVVGVTDRFLDRCPGRAAAGLVAVSLIGWGVVIVRADATVWRGARNGEGYASAQWRNSGLAALVRRTPRGPQLYSNSPGALWALTGRDARCLYIVLAPGPCVSVSVASDQRREVRTPVELAWFRVIRGDAVSLPRARPGCRLSRVGTARDGILFRVTGTRCGSA